MESATFSQQRGCGLGCSWWHRTVLRDQEGKVLAFYMLTKNLLTGIFTEIGWGFGVDMKNTVIFLIKKKKHGSAPGCVSSRTSGFL